MISLGHDAFHITSYKQLGGSILVCQVKTHVQTACDTDDLNMDFDSFDNGYKQLCT